MEGIPGRGSPRRQAGSLHWVGMRSSAELRYRGSLPRDTEMGQLKPVCVWKDRLCARQNGPASWQATGWPKRVQAVTPITPLSLPIHFW